MLADPFWIVQAAFSNIHFSQDKYSSFAIWIHGADEICHITTLSIQRTIYTSLPMCYNDSAKHNSFLHGVTSRPAIAGSPRSSMYKLWQKYTCKKRASNIALSYNTDTDK